MTEANTTSSALPSMLTASLASIAVKHDMDTTITFKDGLSFKLRYITKANLQRLVKLCVTQVYDDKVKGRREKLDNDKFVELFCREAVLGWEGATLRILSGLAPIDTSTFTEEQLDMPLEFSQENLIYVMRNSFDLDEFLQAAACDIKFFSVKREEEIKN